MRRPTYRRAGTRRGPDRRIIAAVAALVAFGGVITVTQISNADESKTAACQSSSDPLHCITALDRNVGRAFHSFRGNKQRNGRHKRHVKICNAQRQQHQRPACPDTSRAMGQPKN